jgi:hypothetical protein
MAMAILRFCTCWRNRGAAKTRRGSCSREIAPKKSSPPKNTSRRTTCVFLRLGAVSCERGISSPSRITHYCVCLGKNGGCWGKATQIPTQSAVRRKPQEVGRGKKKHIGSKFDDLLQFDRLVETVTATATKRVITHQIAMEMKRRRLPVELR